MMSVPLTPLEAWMKAKIGQTTGRALTRETLTAYQLEKMRLILAYVKRHSAFYRGHFAAHDPQSVHGLQDLAQWPLTTVDNLRADPLAFLCVSQSVVERVVTLPAPPGDRHPKRLFFSAADLELAVDFFHQGFSTAVAPGQRMLVLLPCRRPNSVGDLLARGLARFSVNAVAHGPLESPQAAVELILKEQIDCLVGAPTEMAALARFRGAARVPAGQIKSIWLGTQSSRRELAAEIEKFWNCPVFQHYGAAEMCPGGGVQCAARDGFHLREADLLIEIVDPRTAQPVADGAAGEVVVTTLTRQAMPLVRYRTGHRAALLATPCSCGSALRRLKLTIVA